MKIAESPVFLKVKEQASAEKSIPKMPILEVIKHPKNIDVKLVVTVNGKEQVQTTRVIVRPGEVVTATFPPQNSGTATASDRE